jgi:hypothetical protein
MSRTVGFAYAGARMQARGGRLAGAAQWDRLQRLDTPSAWLQAARDTGLGPWLQQIDPAAQPHRIEAQLRELFRRRVAEVARWAPQPWRVAVAWAAVLPDLPVLDRGDADGAPAQWSAAGAAGLAVAYADRAVLGTALQGLRRDRLAGTPAAEAWRRQWHALWPTPRPDERRVLESLVRMLQQAARAAAANAPAAQAALLPPLRRLFRRNTRAPAGLFAFLALTWVEFAALRGALLRRRLGLPLEGLAA